MLVERVFGMLKNRFKIILKIVNITLQHMPHLVIGYICLHNMWIINLDGFDMDSTLEAQRNVEIETKTTFGNLKGVDIFKAAKK